MTLSNLHRACFLVLLGMGICLGTGCQQPGSTPPSDSTATSSTDPAGNGDSSAAAEEVTLDVMSFDEIQELLKQQKGKVVVLDAWSTACPPCMEEFHNLVEIDKQYPDDQVTCISLSFDYDGLRPEMDRYKEPVLNFLKEQNATFTNILSSTDDTTLYEKFDFSAIPAVFVYDQQGNLIERCENSAGTEGDIYDKVKGHLHKLLDNGAAPPAAKEAAETSG